MSTAELLEIEKQLLKLDIQDLQDFILGISAKLYKKKQSKNLPKSIKEGIAQSLKEHRQGLGVILETDEEVQNHFSNLKKQNV